MKHEPIYTCDRCGKKIEYTPKFFNSFSRTLNIAIPPSKYGVVTADIEGFVANVIEKEFPDANKEITLYLHGSTYYSDLDLCADCTKAFRKFMKGKINEND